MLSMGTNNIPTSNHKYWFEIFIFFREYNRQYYEPAYLFFRVHSEVFKEVIIQLQFSTKINICSCTRIHNSYTLELFYHKHPAVYIHTMIRCNLLNTCDILTPLLILCITCVVCMFRCCNQNQYWCDL